MPEQFIQLEQYRRAHDLTYRELTEVIEDQTGFHRDPDCWRKACQGETPRPHARTTYIAEMFLSGNGNGNGNSKRRRRVA